MSDQENRDPQHSDALKTTPQKQQVPSGDPKKPQSEQEKHDQEKKKQA